MLEHFHVPANIEVRVNSDAMQASVEDILRALGLPADDAKQSADVLLYADMRGIDSHGVSNMLRSYVAGLQAGRINPNPKWSIVREAAAVCTIDSDGAHGGVIGPEALRSSVPTSSASAR